VVPDGRRLSTLLGDKLLEVKLNDQERRAVGRLLAERKALLIEITEDTTQSDADRRAGLIKLLVHRHVQKIQGPPSLGHAHHRNRQGFIVASQREAKPPPHLLSESVH
jgi:hypothetical protein